MSLAQVLARARVILAAGEVEDAPLKCELLLRHVLGIDRTGLYLRLDDELGLEEERAFWQLVERGLRHEPASYITGHREFYGLDFYVDSSVLIPRPETELLVEQALGLAQARAVKTIADIGTGCGAIAISLALNLPQAEIYAADISAAALEVARINCWKRGVEDRVHLLSGDMLDPLPGPVDLIVANLPYVKQSDLSAIGRADFEPRLALDGGRDGLDKLRRLCHQAKDKLHPAGAMLLEIGQGQRRGVTVLLRRLFPGAKIEVASDLGGIDRVVSLSLG
ncbi:MAG: peptide chain release factor N(5)-glutamine methyltransferase [Chloroflexi bacterium]|nr:peptide chain release factor N(5)-glutamine methyltransferase [Chloroflexota bacterium]